MVENTRRSLFFLPAHGELMRNSQVVQDPGHDGVDDLFDSLGMGVKSRVGRQNCGAGEQEQFEIFYVNQVEWSFPGHQDQFLFFFEDDISGAEQDIFAIPMRNAAERAHGAGNNNHGVGWVGAAGERGVHAFERMRPCTGRQAQASGQFFGQDSMGVGAEDDIDLVLGGIEVVQQALGVKSAAGAGDGNKNSQNTRDILGRVALESA